MARGGARTGAGRPAVPGSVRWQKQQRKQAKSGATSKAPRPAAAVERPADLPAGQRAAWDALAPHALAAGTLTPATAWAFRDLCEAIVLKRDIVALIEEEGLTTIAVKTRMEQDGSGDQIGEPKAHPLLSRYTTLMIRVEAGLQRFKLAPMGKPMEVAAEEVADAFAAFEKPPALRAVK